MRPVVLAISGSDGSAGAGAQADLKTIEACGARAVTALTAVTAQNAREVFRVEPLDAGLVAAQIEAVLAEGPVAAVKIGMLGDAPVIETVAAALERHRPPQVVLDPVMRAGTGSALLDARACDALGALLPLVTVVTPNLAEAARLAGMEEVSSADRALAAGRRIVARGCPAALVTGGHLGGGEALDLLVTPLQERRYPAPRIALRRLHGAGCCLSSALAAALALGWDLPGAVLQAKLFVRRAILAGLAAGLESPHPLAPSVGGIEAPPRPSGRRALVARGR